MRNFEREVVVAIALAAFVSVNLVSVSASAGDTDVASSSRVQTLEKELAAIKRENELLREIKAARAETSALSKGAPVASGGNPRLGKPYAAARAQPNPATMPARATNAYAADLSTKAPVYKVTPANPSYNWTGFYIGANAGGAVSNSNTSIACLPQTFNLCIQTFAGATPIAALNAQFVSSAANSATFNGGSFTAGGQVGYNRQFGIFVAGVETDLNYNNLTESVSFTVPLSNPGVFTDAFTQSISHRLDWYGTSRLRLGVTPPAVDRLLIYATGGLAYGRVTSNTSMIDSQQTFVPHAGSISETRLGWTAGGGVEAAIAGHWTAKFEYLYMDLGTTNYSSQSVLAGTPIPFGGTYRADGLQTNVTTKEHILRVGLNYKFDDIIWR